MEVRPYEGKLAKPVIELKKYPGFDLLINTRKRDPHLESKLDMKDDKPIESGWTPYIKSTIWTRELEQKKYVLKQRSQADPKEVRIHRVHTEGPRYDPRIINALNSLSQEINLSEDVQGVVASDEAQKIVQAKGFSSINLIEPLIGIIEKTTGRKFMIYPYVEGQILAGMGLAGNPPIMRIHWQDADEMVEELQVLFKKNGIIPEDFDARQLIVSATETGPALSLIDIEQYYKGDNPIN